MNNIMETPKLFIATTALNRPDLHKEIIPDWLIFLKELNLEIIWIINIDCIDKLHFTYEETVENLKNILNGINVIFLPKKIPGFLNSCQRLSQYIYDYGMINIKNNKLHKVAWIEDDWRCRSERFKVKCSNLVKVMGDRSLLNFRFLRQKYIWALNPSIMSYNLFLDLHYSCWNDCKKKNIKGDPEHLLGLYCRKHHNIDTMKSVLILNSRFKAIQPEFNDLNFVKAPYGCIMLLEKQKKPDVILKTLKNFTDTKEFAKTDICIISIAPHMIQDKGREYMELYNIKKNKHDGVKYEDK